MKWSKSSNNLSRDDTDFDANEALVRMDLGFDPDFMCVKAYEIYGPQKRFLLMSHVEPPKEIPFYASFGPIARCEMPVEPPC